MTLASLLSLVMAQIPGPLPQPVPDPARPKPYFSWDYIPMAFHGANRSGVYNPETVELLAKHYQMVTIEKWYTACGSKHPIQNGPWCDVESAMYKTFNEIKAINPNVTTIMYLNSMMDFTMYHLHQMAENLEASGVRVWLRDKHDQKVIYCNDGNYYCNVINWDWTQPAARDLYTSHIINATKVGGVDGIFADHASVRLNNPDYSICNGAGSKRVCYYFDAKFAAAFDAAHEYIVNHTQQILAPLGGPVIDGPYGKYNTDVCDFTSFRTAVRRGLSGHGPYVLEASKGGCSPDDSCIASYLLSAVEYTYLGCLADEPPFAKYPSLAQPLGEPLADAKFKNGVWSRQFSKGAVARWYTNVSKGTMQWPGQPIPPLPGPHKPVGPQNVSKNCGKLLTDMTFASDDVRWTKGILSAQACCDYCIASSGCIEWAWHSETSECHAHGNKSQGPNYRKASFAGILSN